jgi:hypothetical protein
MLPSHQQIEQINEEIEEIRELVYDIVKVNREEYEND